MSYIFDGTDDHAIFSAGAVTLSGGWTFACVIKLDAGVTWQAYISSDSSAPSSLVAMGRHSGGNIATYTGGGANTQTAVSHSSSDGWMLVAATRATGTTITPTMHKYPIGGSPTHTAAGGGQSNQAAANRIVIGAINASDYFKGRLAVAAVWNTNISDANVESLVTTFTRSNWLSLSPAALWDATDQFASDQTGGGANRTSITGTTSSADDPTGWASWAGGGGAPTPKKLAALGVG